MFIGYALGDGHIRDLIYKLEHSSRPKWYIVDPEAEEIDIKFWSSKNIDVIPCRFGIFMKQLDAAIPPLLRQLSRLTDDEKLPISKFYSTNDVESELVRGSLAKDLTFVHAGMPVLEQTAERFYSGYDTGWGCITQRLDAGRKATGELLFKALLENEAPTGPVFILLKGPAGAGKTIALKRAAFDAATANNVLVLWLNDAGQLRSDVFVELGDLTRQPIYLFIDQVSLHVGKLTSFISIMKKKHVPIVLIGAEREADWATYCQELEAVVKPQTLRVGNLKTGEIEALLDLLERHNCLGDLKAKRREDQVKAFASEQFANGQLLVALHVLTRGMPFEKIILNEYLGISNEIARQLYLDIASLNQFGVPVRAGTISRISGITFKEYKDKFFAPLVDIIALGTDAYSGDVQYRTRHSHVAQILFRQVFDTDTAKAKQFERIIVGLDAGYESDSRVLEGICKGRALTENFRDADEVRRIFKVATAVAPKQAYLFQQWAIFESTHPMGDFVDAEFQAETAAWMQPKNQTFVHTQAEVARKRANIEVSEVLREQLRRKVRALLEKMPRVDRFRSSTRCKLMVDELLDLSGTLDEKGKAAQDTLFSEQLAETEATISKAQQQFTDDAEMFEIESRLWEGLKSRDKALRALERAWSKSPRGNTTAVRLGKMYAASGRNNDRLTVLQQAIDRDSDNKAAHYALALHYLEEIPQNIDETIAHCIRCVTIDGQDYEAKYLLAQAFFAKGDVTRASQIFDEIDARAPKNFRVYVPRNENAITKGLPTYTGTVDAVREHHAWIRSGSYPEKIYAPLTSFADEGLENLSVGANVNFRLRFSRKGPVVTSVDLPGVG